MKRATTIILAFMLAVLTHAQHYVGGSIALTSPMQADKIALTQTKIGIGGDIDFSYQLRHNHFLFGVGAGLSYEQNRQRLQDEKLSSRMTDTRGITFTYNGQLASRQDVSRSLYLHTPITIGVEAGHFYLLAGMQFNLFIKASSHQTAQLATVADYEGRYYEIVHDMPTHGYHDFEPVSTRGAVRFKNDMRLIGEIGGTWQLPAASNGLHPIMRVGLFGELGLMNALNNADQLPLSEPDFSQYMSVKMNHVYSSTAANDIPLLRNMSIGLRITYLFPVGGKESGSGSRSSNRSYPCRCQE